MDPQHFLLGPTEIYWFLCPQTVTSNIMNLPLEMPLLQIVSRDVDIPGSLSLKFLMCFLSPWTAWGINGYVSQDGFHTFLSPTQTVFVQSKSINPSKLDFRAYF